MRSDLVQSKLLKQKEIYRSTSQFLLTTVRQTNFEIVLNNFINAFKSGHAPINVERMKAKQAAVKELLCYEI